MKPLVSILIPAYNAAPWIGDTLASAIGQTWPRKEIIVVDDGSSDGTLMAAQPFASRNVRVISQQNQGPSAARNKGLELCQGDYIQYLDADDLLAADKIEKQMEIAEQCHGKRTLFSSAFGSFMYRVSKVHYWPTALWCDLSPVEWLLRKLGQNLFMQTSTWLVSRELTRAAGSWDTRLSLDDDGEYFCRVLLASSGVCFVENANVFYRASGSASLSNVDRSDKKMESQFLSMQLHVKYLRSLEESERVRTACVRYLQTWFIYFVQERPDLVTQLEKMAADLGGQLELPKLSNKYACLERFFGYGFAKRSRALLRGLKWDLMRSWDKALFRLENGQSSNRV